MKVYSCVTTVGQFTIKPENANFLVDYDNGMCGPLIPVTMGRIRELSDGVKLFEPQSEGTNIHINICSIVAITEVDVIDEPIAVDREAAAEDPSRVLSI